jgi:hypothetical protein
MELTKIFYCLISLLLINLQTPLDAQKNWELRKDEKSVKAYTRDYPELSFKEYLVETVVDADLKTVLAAFTDFSKYDLIYPETEGYRIIELTDKSLISYLKIKTPFPAKDRYGIFRNVFTMSSDNKKVHVDIDCLTDEKYQQDGSGILIPFCAGTWDFEQISDNQVTIRHQFISDPGGFAPAFIVNAKTVNNPIKTLLAIKELSKEEKYKKSQFNFTLGNSGQ